MQAIRSQPNGNLDFSSLLRTDLTPLPTNCSSEASAPSRSQSTSSTIVSPDPSNAPCDSSAQSGPRSLKEENYIAIADISSSEPGHPAPLKLSIEEPDLRLGLGHYSSQEASDVTSFHLFPQTPKMVCATPSLGRFRSLSADLQSMNSKRPFSDSIAQGLPTVRKPAFAYSDDLKSGAAASIAYRDIKLAPSKQQPRALYWGIPIGSERSSEPSEKRKFPINSESPISMTSYAEHTTPSMVVVGCSLERDSDKASPAKEQVTGWPPVRSYRRSAINAGRCRPVGTDSDTHGANYVKVNMDGIPVGRKVDLNAFNNYDDLLCSLEGMFGAGGCFLRAGDFVLTYEDKEGDWMLVGDVPWRMFVEVLKRLRITRASDATCVGGSSVSKRFPCGDGRGMQN